MELTAERGGSVSPQPTVLVVDDSRSIRHTLVGILSQSGFHAEGASDGVDGLQRARALVPDLILSDLEMPNATGFELLSAVRSDPQLAMIPFIMVTSVADRSSTRRAMELGADDYLTKPFTPQEVLSIVHARLQKQRSWRQATQALARGYSQGMIGILPHEFRTPLNSILGFAELMAAQAQDGLSPEQTLEFAEVIQRSGKKLLDHTTRFLTLLEYQSCPEMPPGSAAVSHDLVQALVAPCLVAQLPTGQVAAAVDVEPATIACREGLFCSMVRELAGNGLKFARADTSVAVRGRMVGSSYVLDIENVGRPFPLDRMQDVGAFRQFEREYVEQQGLGIGLAIVTHAARLTGSTFDIENLDGGVVRARLTIPLAG